MTNCATGTMTCGIDLGDKWSHLCVVDDDGEVVEESRVRTSRPAITRLCERLEPMRVVMEVGTHSPWVSRLAAEAGHDVIVANARRVQLIAQNDRKTDQVDAELLARLGRVDPELLKPIQHRHETAQRELALIRARAVAVRTRTSLINSVRGQVKSAGYRIKACSSESIASSE